MHGCADLSALIDNTREQLAVVAGGGFGDIRRAVLSNGTNVAVKTLRMHVLLEADSKATKVTFSFVPSFSSFS